MSSSSDLERGQDPSSISMGHNSDEDNSIEKHNKNETSATVAEDPYLVVFDGNDDKEDQTGLSTFRKWLIVIIVSVTSLCVTCISSLWSLASSNIIKEYGINAEVSALGITLFIWGLGMGGIFLAPISEYHGRKIVYLTGLLATLAFQFLTAFCKNIGGVLFGRFASGFFASSFMSVASGTFTDIFRVPVLKRGDSKYVAQQAKRLGRSLVLYSSSAFIGPGLGPIIFGFVNMHPKNYKWTFYTMIIWTFVSLLSILFFVPETYEPILLKRKAQRLRAETGDSNYYAALEKSQIPLHKSILTSCERPLELIFRDQMTFALCFYTAFTLAIVYMFFVSIPYTFQTVYNFNLYQVGLTFIGITLGFSITSLVSPKLTEALQHKLLLRNNGIFKPEIKLASLMVGVFIVPIGLLIMAWTSYSHVHWMGPIIGSFIYASGAILVFTGIFSYQIIAYQKYAASAMSTNSFIRSLLAGSFDLFALKMYKGMGVHWATTFWALFSMLLIPPAFLFYIYGEDIRKKSRFTWSD